MTTRLVDLGRHLGPRLVHIGRYDLPVAVDAEIRRVDPEAALGDDLSGAACVLDTRDVEGTLLSALRRKIGERVPVLVVHVGERSDEDLDVLGATEVLRLPASHGELRRRVASILERGRSSLALSFAEQALARSVNGLSMADGALPDRPLVYVSKAFETMTGYPAASALGRNCRFLQGDDADQAGVALLRAASAGRSECTAVVRNVRRDGTRFWNEVTLFPFELAGERGRWIGGVQHDVTALHEAASRERELREQLLRQRAFAHRILERLEIGVVTADADGSVTFMNDAAQALIAGTWSASECSGLRELLALGQHPRDLLGADARMSVSCTVLAPSGSPRELDVLLSRGAAGDDTAEFFAILRDRTAEQKGERERRRVEHRLGMATLAAGFAHEIRNPIAGIRSLAEDIADIAPPELASLPHLPKLLSLVGRIERLVHTTLAFGRPPEARLGWHDAGTILAAALSGIAHRAPSSVVVEASPEIPDVFCDPARIAEALVIFMDNGIDAAGGPEHVVLRASVEGADHVRFDVVDDGPGVASEIFDQVFDPFFTTKPSAVGLGLAVAQQIAVENDARIHFTSRPRRTVFSIMVRAS